MKFKQTEPENDFGLQAYSSGQYLIEVNAFAMGQYRIQVWWRGPVGHEYRYPDGVSPNF